MMLQQQENVFPAIDQPAILAQQQRTPGIIRELHPRPCASGWRGGSAFRVGRYIRRQIIHHHQFRPLPHPSRQRLASQSLGHRIRDIPTVRHLARCRDAYLPQLAAQPEQDLRHRRHGLHARLIRFRQQRIFRLRYQSRQLIRQRLALRLGQCHALGIAIGPQHHAPAGQHQPIRLAHRLAAAGPAHHHQVRQFRVARVSALLALHHQHRRLGPRCQPIQAIQRPRFRKRLPMPLVLPGLAVPRPQQRQRLLAAI